VTRPRGGCSATLLEFPPGLFFLFGGSPEAAGLRGLRLRYTMFARVHISTERRITHE
jgi:hypothetical protein